MMQKYELEYSLNSSPKVLYNRLSTPAGLAEWFADDVNVVGETYSFIWDGSEEKACVIQKKDLKYIRFKWLDEDSDKSYFEFRIEQDELTNDVSLLITDFADHDEIDDATELWNTQVSELKRVIGI